MSIWLFWSWFRWYYCSAQNLSFQPTWIEKHQKNESSKRCRVVCGNCLWISWIFSARKQLRHHCPYTRMSRYKESWHDLICLLFFLPAIRVRDSCHVLEPKGANGAEFYVSTSRNLNALHKSQDFQILENWIMYTGTRKTRKWCFVESSTTQGPPTTVWLVKEVQIRRLSRDCDFPLQYSAS